MDQEIKTLIEVLAEHHSQHEILLQLEETKRKAIVKNDIDRLAALLAEQSLVMDLVLELEEKRSASMQVLAIEMNLPENPKVSDIAERLNGEEQGVLMDVRNRLQKTLLALRKSSERNADLIKASVAQIKSFFAAISEARTVNPVYTRGGKTAGGQVRLLDHTA